MHPANGDLILKEEYWPADARWILTEFLMSDEGAQRGNATPRFILRAEQEDRLHHDRQRRLERENVAEDRGVTGTKEARQEC